MTRNVCLMVVGALSTLLLAPVPAQQLQPPTQGTQPAPQGTGIGPRLNTARPTPPSSIRANPSQRPPTIAPIPSTGPSVPPPVKIEAKPIEPAARNAPKRVLDEQGRLVPGALQVSPTRAYDPATGRYFQTVPVPVPTPPH